MAMPDDAYRVTGTVEVFPQPGGWHYVPVPPWITEEVGHLADRGLVAIRATVGTTTWDTSLLPMGDGSHFVALNARARRANDLEVGSPVTIMFRLRER